MQLTNILVAALAGSATAASAAYRAARRQAAPVECPRVGASDPNFEVADLAGSTGAATTEVLDFAVGPVPAGTGPCSLIGQFNAGFPVDLAGGALSRLDVRNAANGALVGSFPPLKVENGAVVEDTLVTVNSFACEEHLSFEFAVAGDAGAAEDARVAFTAGVEGGFFIKVGDQCNV